ncbi:MAG: hypothetical protein Q7S86_05440 [bacterium]|nr:hypothetical protein [bacterium]
MTEEENTAAANAAPKPLRTYQSDVEAMLKQGEGSLAKIAIAENDRRIRSGLSTEEPEKPERTKLVLGISLGLIILGAGTLGFLYLFRNTEQGPVPLTEETPTIIVTDIEKDFDIKGLSRDRLLETLGNEQRGNESALSSVVGFRLMEGTGKDVQTVTTSAFLKKLQAQAPDSLVRSFTPNFLFGLHILNVNHPFLIFKTGYYQNVYAGMLTWEKTIIDDLGPIFINPEPATAAETSDQILDRNKNFEDIVVKNRDTRALRNQDGKIIFLYSFPDKNTLVITTNADTLEKISARLLSGKLIR